MGAEQRCNIVNVVNTRGFALDACIPVNSTRYVRFTCNSHHAIGAFYNSPNCAVGTETKGLMEEVHILNQCSPYDSVSSERWTMNRCTSDLSTLPIFADSMLSSEYGTSGCNFEPVAFQAVPAGICTDFDSVGSYARFDCDHGQLYETKFEDPQCTSGEHELPVEDPTCRPNTGPQGLKAAYSKRECYRPLSSEPNDAISAGYFYRNMFKNAECDGTPVYQDGFRLKRCLPLYSTQGISKGSYYGKCTIDNNEETLLEYITFKNMNCAGAGVSTIVRVGKDTCHESPPFGIQQGMHYQFHCSSEGTIEDFPAEHRIPNAIVLGGVEDQIVCNNLENYNVFAVYSTTDRFGTENWSFSLTCNSQTWYNSSENTIVSFSLETDPGSSCKSTESADYKSLVTNQWHLAQMFWLSPNFTGSTMVSLDEIFSTNLISREHASSLKNVRRLSEGDASDTGWAMRTYYSDSQCYGMEILYVGYRLDTCITTFNAFSGKAIGSVKYTCDGYDDTFVFASSYSTSDCSLKAHKRSLFDGPVGHTGICDNQNFDLIHESAEGVYQTYISRAHSRAWKCTPDRVLPVQTSVILTKGFSSNDSSCSADAMPLFFTAIPTENCMALNGTLLESVRYACLGGKQTMSTYSGSFCQDSLINHAPVGNLTCKEGYVKNQLENTSPQAYQTTSCYNPATVYFGGDKNYYYGGGDDDLWLDKFSFVNVMCRSVSTDLETSAPTEEPTAIPSKRSKPTRAPTSFPTIPLTAKPIGGEEVNIFFSVTQGISGCTISTFTTFLELYTKTFKETVAASMNSSFVTSKSITNMIAGGALSIHRRLESARLTLHYAVKTTVPTSAAGVVNSASLSTALVDSVQNGHFNSLLKFYASVNGATGLNGALSESISVTLDEDNHSGSAHGGLSETDMILAVVLALAGVGCLLTCCYRARRGGNNYPPCCARRSSRGLGSSSSRSVGGAYRGRRGAASAYDGYSYEDSHGLAERGFDEIPPLGTTYSPRFKIHGRRLGAAKSFDSEL